MKHLPDLYVAQRWNTLAGKTLDVAVTGSIAAVESPRFIRSLRRLGADVFPYLSEGGSRFITDTSLSWASGGKPVQREFAGDAPHIATRDALIIAPASANTISKISLGITDTPITALAASYLGAGKPLLLLPTMHSSLGASPFIRENLQRLSSYAMVLKPRLEEGKAKFPGPRRLADEVSHLLNRSRWTRGEGVVLTMGSTRGYIDDIRYISNYSSGRLGSMIAEELYRRGLFTTVVSGPCLHKPRVYSQLKLVETNEEMLEAASIACSKPHTAGVFAAAVLDFVPQGKVAGKIKSSQQTLQVEMGPGLKVIAGCQPSSGIKVGFKLEVASPDMDSKALALTYCQREKLTMLVLNYWHDIGPSGHKAIFYGPSSEQGAQELGRGHSKRHIATAIADHIVDRF
jgi:phosphopantothenoylcysteine decarboxylase / phosphopantothenate---cysteine ligase